MENYNNIINIIDDNKEKFTDSEYKLLMDSIMNLFKKDSDLDIRPNDINNLMYNALTYFEQTYYNIHKIYPSKEHVLKYFRFSSHLNLKDKYIPLSNHM